MKKKEEEFPPFFCILYVFCRIMMTIGCPMSFQQYPMDLQECNLKMQSCNVYLGKYSNAWNNLTSFFIFITVGYDISYYNYSWLREPHLNTNVHLDNHDVRISKFTFTTSRDNLVYPGLGVKVRLKRHFGYHLTQTYIPSIIFVLVAWVSFHVPSDVVPGRMVLCVTTLLTLTAMFNSVRYECSRISNNRTNHSYVAHSN